MHSKRALLISFVLGAVAVLLMYWYTNEKIRFYAKKYKLIPIVIASKDILQNTILDETMLEYRDIPSPYIEPNAIQDKNARVGFLAAINIKAGEQITEQKLMRLGEGISAQIPKGKRAVTISINEITGVAGLIRPGDRVDIVGIFKTVDQKTKLVGTAEAVTLIQNVEVLAVGRNYMIESFQSQKSEGLVAPPPSDVSFSNVTVLLPAREAMDLILAQDLGTLTLTLRPRFDYDPPKIDESLRNQPSTPESATGIRKPLDIAPGPRWLEQRGGKSVWVR